MAGKIHEIRDTIHAFIKIDSGEREIVDSAPVQRLRYIHQLALTYLVYPGATHRRFEHSLGVMELAGRVYDVVTRSDNIYHDEIRRFVPGYGHYDHQYWRRPLRLAALCHDVGHLPFSHAAEKELLPAGWNHERLTVELINSEMMKSVWDKLKINAEDVAKLAVGPAKYGKPLTSWESILSEIISGDAFGVDRMDYLLRDSRHAGVPYGGFDHYRLIDTLRILPRGQDSEEPQLGVEEGGLQSAEALLWARYFMYTQVYFHPVRRIYDIHLRDFLKQTLTGGQFSTDAAELLKTTDNEVTVSLMTAASDPGHPGHATAKLITRRGHYRLLYHRNPEDQERNIESVKCVYDALVEKFGADAIRQDTHSEKRRGIDFPVYGADNRIASSISMSDTLRQVPVFAVDYLFIRPDLREEASRWLQENRNVVIPENHGGESQ